MVPFSGMVWLNTGTQPNQSSIREVPVSFESEVRLGIIIVVYNFPAKIKSFPPRRWLHSPCRWFNPLNGEARFLHHSIFNHFKEDPSFGRPQYETQYYWLLSCNFSSKPKSKNSIGAEICAGLALVSLSIIFQFSSNYLVLLHKNC